MNLTPVALMEGKALAGAVGAVRACVLQLRLHNSTWEMWIASVSLGRAPTTAGCAEFVVLFDIADPAAELRQHLGQGAAGRVRLQPNLLLPLTASPFCLSALISQQLCLATRPQCQTTTTFPQQSFARFACQLVCWVASRYFVG